MQLHIFVNAFWNKDSGMSGGDRRILEILKQWNKNGTFKGQIMVYAPLVFHRILEKEGLKGTYTEIHTEDNEVCEGNPILCYLKRTIRAIKVIHKNSILDKTDIGGINKLEGVDSDSEAVEDDFIVFYSTSDYFPDVFPCVYSKFINKAGKEKQRVSWIALVHHVLEHYSTRRGSKLMNFISYELQQFSFYLMRKHSDKTFVVSPLVIEYLKSKKRFPENKLIRINNGVDCEYIDSCNLTDDSLRGYDGVFLGRLAMSKGVTDLPEIWAKVVEKLPNARLAVIGGGSSEMMQELNSLCEQYHVEDNIDFLGFLDNEHAYSLMKQSKVFVFTSREEGWGISIAEAMACGLPVVAYELPVYKHIFPEGIELIADRDSEKMATTIINLLNIDANRSRIAETGRSYVIEHYAWNSIADTENNKILA